MIYLVSKLVFDHLGNLRIEERSKEAIPIEWARKWSIDNYPYTALVMSEIIPKMIEDWEKENETDR